MKVVPRSSIDVGKFFESEEFPDLLRRTSKDIAVIGTSSFVDYSHRIGREAHHGPVSGDQTLRDKVRTQVLSLKRIDIRYSESEYQPA